MSKMLPGGGGGVGCRRGLILISNLEKETFAVPYHPAV